MYTNHHVQLQRGTSQKPNCALYVFEYLTLPYLPCAPDPRSLYHIYRNKKERFGLFGFTALHPQRKIEGGWINLHLLIWKQLIALLVRIEEEGEKFSAQKVWAPAWMRFEKKVLAHNQKRRRWTP